MGIALSPHKLHPIGDTAKLYCNYIFDTHRLNVGGNIGEHIKITLIKKDSLGGLAGLLGIA